MASLCSTTEQVGRRASVSASTVRRVLKGDAGVHLDTLCAVADAVGLRIGVKAFPSAQPALRDTGQLTVARYLVDQAHQSLRYAMEVPVGDPYGRAADLVFFGADEILHVEIERRLAGFEAPYRAASVKREALQAKHPDRPVRLVLVIEDTRRNRDMIAPHSALIVGTIPAGSRDVLRAIRTGTPLGRDGILWVRPWRSLQHANGPDG